MDLKDHIRSIPDFPKPGILFYGRLEEFPIFPRSVRIRVI